MQLFFLYIDWLGCCCEFDVFCEHVGVIDKITAWQQCVESLTSINTFCRKKHNTRGSEGSGNFFLLMSTFSSFFFFFGILNYPRDSCSISI
jgi:hypothetical protein